MKHEAKFQSAFNRWLKYNWDHTSAFELKVTITKHFYPVKVVEHQRENLLLATNKFIYKIPDDSIGQKPFDCLIFVKVDAYVVVHFKRRGNKQFYLIEINDFLKINSTSLTEEEVDEIAYEVGKLQ